MSKDRSPSDDKERFDELDSNEDYDAVWANASLRHVPRPALPHILGLIFKTLKPDGLHFATYKAGGVEGRDDYGRYYNCLGRADVLDLYRAVAPLGGDRGTQGGTPMTMEIG